MNYSSIYDRLISKHGSVTKPKGVYTERHRKLPGCLGGEYVAGNAFYMSPSAHRLAHLLLVKIYPDSDDLVYAANLMCNVTGRTYTWLKERHADVARAQLSLQRKDPKFLSAIEAARLKRLPEIVTYMKEHNPMKDPEVLAKVSGDNHYMKNPANAKRVIGEGNPMYGKTGEANPFYGKTHTEETRKKISERTSAAQKGKPLSEKNKQGIRDGWARRIARLKLEKELNGK